ncbi:helix-turn-helix domain-containing protein [Cetobacterium sp.]|uniref:helix-turn-helix domain-containing protein n=1 Tax=Cetobacterium sp. TaxID=2071632 RepID=UPI003EE64A05
MSSKRGRISNSFEDKILFSNIGARITLLQKEKKINGIELSHKLGITPQALSSMFVRLRKGEGVEIPTLYRVAKALDVDLKDFF